MSELDFDFSTHPHDGFAKAVFSDPARAVALFRGHLPAELAACIDWATLVHVPGSFVKKSLQQAHSDLLFTVDTHSTPVLLYLLFEHQTSVDPRMPLRLLDYVTQILLEHEKEHGLPLPGVVPFVLHQGPTGWSVSTQFEDLYALPEAIAPHLLPYLPKFQHLLLDLSKFDPAREERDAHVCVVLQLMKLARANRLMSFFEWLGREPQAVQLVEAEGLFNLCILYAYHVDANLDVSEISSNLSKIPKLGGQAMTTAQRLFNEGHEEGREKGREEGREKGHVEGREEGEWIGKVVLLEEMLEVTPPTSREVLQQLKVSALQQRYEVLQSEYAARFKKP